MRRAHAIIRPVAIVLALAALSDQRAAARADGGPAGTLGCDADITPVGGDGSVSVVDLLELLAQWGPCKGCDADIAPSGGNGVVDVVDLLALLAQWGPCPDCDDNAEPNDSCGNVFTLPSLASSGPNQNRVWSTSTLLEGDVDLYRIDANETDSSCSCCDQFCFDEDYLVQISLAVPGDATGSYRFGVGLTCTTSPTATELVVPGSTGAIAFWIDGGCPEVDDFTFYVLVTGDGSAASCLPYTLTYSFTPGCQ